MAQMAYIWGLLTRCLDPQTSPEKAFKGSKHLLIRDLEDFGRLGISRDSSSWDHHDSGQIIIFHQARFPWNKRVSLTKRPFGGNRSCEVAIIWPDDWSHFSPPAQVVGKILTGGFLQRDIHFLPTDGGRGDLKITRWAPENQLYIGSIGLQVIIPINGLINKWVSLGSTKTLLIGVIKI